MPDTTVTQYTAGALAELLGLPVAHVRGAVRGLKDARGQQRKWFTDADLPVIQARLAESAATRPQAPPRPRVAVPNPPALPEAPDPAAPPPAVPVAPIADDEDLGEREPVSAAQMAAAAEEAAQMGPVGRRRRRASP